MPVETAERLKDNELTCKRCGYTGQDVELYYVGGIGDVPYCVDNEACQKRKKVALIEEALRELCHVFCPYCQAEIGIDKYVSEKDIENWLEKKKTVVRRTYDDKTEGMEVIE